MNLPQKNELIYPVIIKTPDNSKTIFPIFKKKEIFIFSNKKIGRHKKFSQQFRLKTKNNPDNIFRKKIRTRKGRKIKTKSGHLGEYTK